MRSSARTREHEVGDRIVLERHEPASPPRPERPRRPPSAPPRDLRRRSLADRSGARRVRPSVEGGVRRVARHDRQGATLAPQDPAPQPFGVGRDRVAGFRPDRRTTSPGRSPPRAARCPILRNPRRAAPRRSPAASRPGPNRGRPSRPAGRRRPAPAILLVGAVVRCRIPRGQADQADQCVARDRAAHEQLRGAVAPGSATAAGPGRPGLRPGGRSPRPGRRGSRGRGRAAHCARSWDRPGGASRPEGGRRATPEGHPASEGFEHAERLDRHPTMMAHRGGPSGDGGPGR